ncbi:sugar ABC transporter substrate-binding protein [Defluviitalea saccharophila]|uniref:Sugar ABC transporter substrate-binding protein n=1 Tax=Defluviitalea saccharophila TaxID=879970 RepID=A0ABZ2Y113_9FIRM|nr:sugar ABC transporter substrate-binding protein [Candidatus Epulonipiscium sp.]
MMKKFFALFLVSILMISALTACGAKQKTGSTNQAETETSGTENKDKKLKIAFAFQDLETEFWVAAHKTIIETLTAQGIEVIERNANEDANKQLEQVKDAIAQGADGIIVIPQDGESALTIIDEANKAGVPIAIFNRPPSNDSNNAIVVVADNAVIAEAAVDHMVAEAQKKFEATGKKLTPLIMVGDLGDPNAIARKDGFYKAIQKNPDIFNDVIEVPTKWDGATALANLQSAMQANPEVDFLYTCSDFMFPQIKAVLEPLGKWKKVGEEGHVIMGGLDGDSTAGRLIDEGYVDSTGVQDLKFESEAAMNAILKAIEAGEKTPKEWIQDPGFALTQANLTEKRMDMWGNQIREN